MSPLQLPLDLGASFTLEPPAAPAAPAQTSPLAESYGVSIPQERAIEIADARREALLATYAASSQPDIRRHADHPFFGDEFAFRVAGALRAYHAMFRCKVGERVIEALMESELRLCGHDVGDRGSITRAAEDLIVDGVKVSLKTQWGEGIKSDSVTISKLMENAGSGTLGCVDDAMQAIPRIIEHLGGYQHIYMLRCLPAARALGCHQANVRYELVEIPVDIFTRYLPTLEPHNVGYGRPRKVGVSRSGSASATVQIGGQPAYTLLFDGSARKIGIRDLGMRHCQRILCWDVPAP